MLSIKGYIQLTRPVNLVIAFLSIFIGGFVAGRDFQATKLILACFSGVLIMAGGNAINDVYDLNIDRINKPERPLPRGLVSVSNARIFALFLFVSGCIIGSLINLICFGIVLTASILLYLYSRQLKRTVLWGNFTVAFISGLAFLYGGLAIGKWEKALAVGIFAFFYHFAREIIKDMEDMEGDRLDGVVTLPIRFGIRTAQIWATGLIIILVILTMIPYYIIDIFSKVAYVYIVFIGVDLVLIGVVISMWVKPEPKNWGRLSVIMKTDMFIGLIAVYFGN